MAAHYETVSPPSATFRVVRDDLLGWWRLKPTASTKTTADPSTAASRDEIARGFAQDDTFVSGLSIDLHWPFLSGIALVASVVKAEDDY